MSNVTNYKIAVKYRDNRDLAVFHLLCSCGHHETYNGKEKSVKSCPKCENDNIIMDYKSNGISEFTRNSFKTINKADTGFHIKRQEYKITVDKDNNTISVIETSQGELMFSLRDKSFYITRNGKVINPAEKNIDEFFSGTAVSEVLDAISNDYNRSLYSFAYHKLGKMHYERTHKWARALKRLKAYPAVEIVALSPLNTKLPELWANTTLREVKEYAPLHKIIGLPKYMIPFLVHVNIGPYTLRKLNGLASEINGNTVKELLQIFKEESNITYLVETVDLLLELHNDYSYKDMKKLALYLTREVKLQQGITRPLEAATLLRDYVRMCTLMDVEYNKYPKSLKKDHDVTMMNYEANKDTYKQKQFSKVVESEDYQNLMYKGKEYSIVIPETIDDVIKEGKSLSHCVASYVDDIIKKKCKIVFLRKTENTNNPLVTVEVRGNIIRQVRGQHNRKPYAEEMEFVNKWAKEKELEVKIY